MIQVPVLITYSRFSCSFFLCLTSVADTAPTVQLYRELNKVVVFCGSGLIHY